MLAPDTVDFCRGPRTLGTPQTMQRVTLDDLDPEAPPDENVPAGALAQSIGGVRQLDEALDVTGFSMNHFELAPGESPAHSMHKHPEQEEVFYVLDGTVSVETPDGEPDRTLDADEALRVPPDTYQFVVNRSDDQATLLALGAPREYQDEGSYLVDCPDCGDRTEQTFNLVESDDEPRALVCVCLACGEESHRITV